MYRRRCRNFPGFFAGDCRSVRNMAATILHGAPLRAPSERPMPRHAIEARTGRAWSKRCFFWAAMALACFVATPVEARRHPRLFDSYELASHNLRHFPQWLEVLRAFRDDPCKTASCADWRAFINGLKTADLPTQLREVNRAINDKPYRTDHENWKTDDHWATPYQFIAKSGDCEDFAIAKYMALRALGFSAENLRILAVEDFARGTYHALLVVYVANRPLLLDNQLAEIVPADRIKTYRPIYSLNESGWWLHFTFGRAVGSNAIPTAADSQIRLGRAR